MEHLYGWVVLLVTINTSGFVYAIPQQKRHIPDEQRSPDYWFQNAQDTLEKALKRQPNTNKAKNVILFLGDGMSISTVTAARILKGQRENGLGEDTVLAFEDFPNVALSKTYTVDHQIADSAATATAFLCGMKANYGTLGMDARAERGDCRGMKGKNVTCIAELARRAGKRTGLVTTARVTHATPAPLFAFTPDRMWENDKELPADKAREGCEDVAAQMATSGVRNLNVVLGGGRQGLFPKTVPDPVHINKTGQRQDGRNIVQEWLDAKRDLHHESADYVWTKSQLREAVSKGKQNVIGLFEYSHINFVLNRSADEPSLAEMVDAAIDLLSNDEGYFMLVEGARIDHGHHHNKAHKALEETLDFEAAVTKALEKVSLEDTLIIVTADHSHPLTIASYAMRGNPILGLTDYSDEVNRTWLSDVDNKPYTTLGYINGPAHYNHRPLHKHTNLREQRINLSTIDVTAYDYMQDTAVPVQIVTHEGTDVGIYATGPMSHLFHSTHEQHYIFHVMTYAACLRGEEKYSHCNRYSRRLGSDCESVGYASTSAHVTLTSPLFAYCILVTILSKSII